ncbi:hypothetical protein [Plantactinospora soyae]|uniref:ATP/GTP-binding protein n=1 Tax=Plantactinospora soyae TaxID=1544732 RepID=A0A927M365_9ACTN|nr:hypothetical protein [Plantactinospora soyae]MBE1485826.1 hypothetical protein [Plantactinospora soyae]
MLTRRVLGAGAAGVLVLAATIVLTGGPAAARDPVAECPPGQGNCDVWEHLPGEPGDDDSGGSDDGDGGGSGGGDRVCKKDDGTVVPCYDELRGWFNSADDCYYKRMEPQSPETPAGMTSYLKTCGGPATAEPVFLADPPAGFEPPDPREMALDLLAGLDLAAPQIRTAPSGTAGLVGVPVWLYDASSWARVGADASAGGVTVEIEAIPTKVVWDMGNGDPPVTCTSAGIPFKAGQHDPRRPPAGACTYDGYPRSSQGLRDGKYQITATKHWTVPWSSSTGDDEPPLAAQLTTEGSIQIDELQVVTR